MTGVGSMQRGLLESSWRRFGPAGRASYEWVTPVPSAREQQGFDWKDLGHDGKYEALPYVLLPAAVLLLALLALVLFRRCRASKPAPLDLMALELGDGESGAELLSSLSRHASTGSASSDGVLLVVYLPTPYRESLGKIARAASLASSKDGESVKMDDPEGDLCLGLGAGGRYV